MTDVRRFAAIRGATTLELDSHEQVIERTQELIRAMFERNELQMDDLVSLVFTATDDIHSAFPAEAARRAGITQVPLLCARELDIETGIPLCIRVLAHVETSKLRSELRHPYLHEARQLRTDLPE